MANYDLSLFSGHLLYGTYFGLVSIWWTVNICQRYYISMRKNGKPFRSSFYYAGPFCRTFPVESALKIFMFFIGLPKELPGFYLDDFQHLCILYFAGFTGALELARHYKCPIPDGIERAALILTYALEAFMFYNHLHGRTPMNAQLHMLLVCIVTALALSLAAQSCFPNNVVCSLASCYFFLLQGTWLWHIGFALYGPSFTMTWDEHSHNQMMVMIILFMVHFAVNFWILFVVGGVVWFITKRRFYYDISGESISEDEKLVPFVSAVM